MAGSVFGTNLTISTWGESHGAGVGVVIDGVPAGIPLLSEDIQKFLDRRRPGQSAFTTPRKESDMVEILSGVYEGLTTGCPVSMMIRNADQHSKDYGALEHVYRPGHADYTYAMKYGIRDHRGGGRSSGRETIGRVSAGALCWKALNYMGIFAQTFTRSVADVEISEFKPDEISRNPLYMPDQKAAEKASKLIKEAMKEGDSLGGVVECRISGVPAGIGEPAFQKLDALLAQAMLSIGAAKGFEMGDGFLASRLKGSENNDSFRMENENVVKTTNHSGGVLGGISDGSEVCFKVAFKPTPSISKPQETVTDAGEDTTITIAGRHDPIIVPRAVVVVESMAGIVLLDLMCRGAGSRLENLEKIYVSVD